MSTVVNGHREEEAAHSRTTHQGHILPMLSFSASTPTDEENPLDRDPAIAIDMPLWEQPEDVVDSSMAMDNLQGSQAHHHDAGDDGRDTETTPLIDVDRVGVLVDGVRDYEDEEPDENAPLLGGSGGGGGGLGSAGGTFGGGGLALPVNMPRSPQDTENLLQEGDAKAAADPELINVANQFVTDIITKAQVEATKKLPSGDKDEAAASTAGGTGGSAPGLVSPSSTPGERVYRRGGPWYVQMGRVFASFLSRICPCRCPTKP